VKMSPLVGAALRDEPKAPSPKQLKIDGAHRAHREMVEGWIRGDVSDEKMKRSKGRLERFVKDKGR
jgi:hypothetical protein